MRLVILVALLAACGEGKPEVPAVPVAPTPQAVNVDLARKDLVFRYLDPQSGEVATATTLEAIPPAAHGEVVVYDPSANLPPGWDLVADLARGTSAIPREHFAFATRAARAPSSEQPAAAPVKSAGHEVVMFSTAGCGYCAKARKYLTENRVPFTELDVEEDPQAPGKLSALGQRAGLGARDLQGVPIIFVDGKPILGWDQRRLASLLGVDG